MTAIAAWALRTARPASWHRDAAFAIITLVGCARAAFVPAAHFAGIEVTRHMLGSNLATALAFVLSAMLLASMVSRGVAAGGAGDHAGGAIPGAGPAAGRAGGPAGDGAGRWHRAAGRRRRLRLTTTA
jgi:hypothetical protein